MSIAGFIIGILTGIGATVSIIPLLGWLNWLNIPVAALGLIFSIIGVSRNQNRGLGIAGIAITSPKTSPRTAKKGIEVKQRRNNLFVDSIQDITIFL